MASVTLSGIGIVGDMALLTTPGTTVGGLGLYGVSEIVEFGGAVENLKVAYDLFTERDLTGVCFAAAKGTFKLFGLAPLFGTLADVASIGVEIMRNTYLVPIYQKKRDPIMITSPGFPLPPNN